MNTKMTTSPVFGITGWKNAGKTTMTEKLVRELTQRGWRVSTIKHAHHDFDIDVEGTDSWRHRKAGAGEVAVVSSRRFAIIHENMDEAEPCLDDILARLSPADLVLVEGYKQGTHPKLEVIRQASQKQAPIYETNETIIALASDLSASDLKQSGHLPLFQLNDITSVADFIERFCGLKKS
ncbi:molybdopterin-guanine dinucleotide biosynthesis protein B [Paenochrobactrum glaciei]|uniref:Molybdopterin-guanine dinucleotide biosynthesis protein B n=2 Tax=Paenochrobactrum glaciei TaxID=486407 RepID=A0ABN1FG29_9HYPH